MIVGYRLHPIHHSYYEVCMSMFLYFALPFQIIYTCFFFMLWPVILKWKNKVFIFNFLLLCEWPLPLMVCSLFILGFPNVLSIQKVNRQIINNFLTVTLSKKYPFLFTLFECKFSDDNFGKWELFMSKTIESL